MPKTALGGSVGGEGRRHTGWRFARSSRLLQRRWGTNVGMARGKLREWVGWEGMEEGGGGAPKWSRNGLFEDTGWGGGGDERKGGDRFLLGGGRRERF